MEVTEQQSEVISNKKPRLNIPTVKIFKNGVEVEINEDTSCYVYTELRKKMYEVEAKYNKLCFYIVSMTHEEVVYWYCQESRNASYYSTLIDDRIDEYNENRFDKRNGRPYVDCGYTKEQSLKSCVKGNEKYRAYMKNFVMKRIENTEFLDLPKRLTKKFVREQLSTFGLLSLEKQMKNLLKAAKDCELNASYNDESSDSN